MRRVPQGGKVEDVGRQRETSLRRTAEVEPETGKQFTQAMVEVEERRRAAVNAEEDVEDGSMLSCVKSKRLKRDEVQRVWIN